MPLVQTRGAASAQGFGEFAQVTAANYIEDVFQTWLHTGNGATGQTITNGIDLSGKGGLTWIKCLQLNGGETSHRLYDTLRGAGNSLQSEATAATSNQGNSLTAFNNNGFTLGGGYLGTNGSGYRYTSWTFREQPKFFDIVTYTGTGVNRSIAHSLGSTPGFVIVKRTDTAGAWYCNPVAFTGWTDYLVLNSTAARATDTTVWNSTSPTSTTFTVGTNAGVNASGGTYVAYLFADNAGGFGLTGTDSVISTTLVSSAGSGNTTVNLGFEPQFLILKKTATTGDWFMYDVMRGMSYSAGASTLFANTDGVETTGITVSPTATGFTAALDNSFTYFCLAIRRGPMKVPTTGTSVLAIANTASTPLTLTSNSNQVSGVMALRTSTNIGTLVAALTQRGMPTYQQFDESSFGSVGSGWTWATQNGLLIPSGWGGSGNYVTYCLGRAPSFFDVACYTGSNGYQDLSHNLGVIPEMVIIKNRTSSQAWTVGLRSIVGTGKYLTLNTTAAVVSDVNYFGGPWTSAYVQVDGNLARINQNGSTYVMYLFATCPGVSKVGSYTGTGTTQTINCGFTAGARFIYIKRTDSTGDWYVWDSVRGIVSGNDPYLLTNTNDAEVTGTDYVDTNATGFEISSTAPAAINANGGTYIFLAIA